MQYALRVFYDDNDNDFRVIDRDGEPWFILSDVCKALDLAEPHRAASRLDDDEKGRHTVTTLGGPQELLIINESGLYSLVLTSRKPGAKRFKKWVTSVVLPSIRKTGGYGSSGAPAFIRRFNQNWDRVDAGYFSVINELVVRLHGRLEMVGHIIADRGPDGKEIRPDNSVGRLFADWLRKHHPTITGGMSYYIHTTDEWEGEARQYPMSMLPLFIEYVDAVWVPEHAERYFGARDPAALPYLPRLLPSHEKPRAGMTRRVTVRRRAS